jgi:hypothetical protein
VEQSPLVEMHILDQVSQMTLGESSSAPSPRFQTPQVRKRSSSFVVTPPAVPLVQQSFDEDEYRSARKALSTWNMPRGLPPMMPDSPELDCASSDHNPFGRHRPLHSPFTGVSRVNADFLTALQAQTNNSAGSSSQQTSTMPRLAHRQPRQPLTSMISQFQTTFPELDDDDDVEPTNRSSISNARGPNRTTRALKMRRRNQDEYPVFQGNL